jgi:hypothetical protein
MSVLSVSKCNKSVTLSFYHTLIVCRFGAKNDRFRHILTRIVPIFIDMSAPPEDAMTH